MDIKKEIYKELEKAEFPNLKFLYSEEALDLALEVLKELLSLEEKKFEELISKKNEEINFDNFEDAGILDYYWSIINHLENINSNEKTRKIIEEFRPMLQDFGNRVAYSREYYEKLEYVNKHTKLDIEQKRIMHLSIKAYRDRGIDLSEKKQQKLKEINKELGELSDKFGNNVIDSEKQFEYLITDYEIIRDLPKEVLEIAAKAGEEKGGYLFDSDPTSTNAIMKYCIDRDVRRDFELAGYTTASNGEFDNRKNVLKILELKCEKARILGYKNYAELSLNSKMAKNPKKVIKLLKDIHKRASAKTKKEVKELKKFFSLREFKSYDFAYYSRILKEEKYKVDEKDLKNYFEYESVLDYLHRFIEKFYSITIKEIKEDSYDKDIRVYEIYKGKKLISYYFIDAFYRKGKRHGAWADNLRSRTYLPKNKVPIILNTCNFQKSLKGKTTLYIRDVETLFHEFGHAIHEILSLSKYSDLSGFNVEWDFVEVPSQLLENWVSDRKSMKKLAKNIDSGESISEETLDKLDRLKTYMTGHFWMRQNQFALLDMNIFSSSVPRSIKELDEKILDIVNKYSSFKRDKDYKMYCSFTHIFDGGYSAGYYSYMWAEIIEADIFSRVKELGIFKSEIGKLLIDTIIGQGTIKKANELFFDFMGREVSQEAFLDRYGF